MTPAAVALLARLAGVGASVAVEGDNLRIRSPMGTLTLADLEEIRQAKPALLEPLRHPIPLDASGDPDGPCPRCGRGTFWRPSLTPGAAWRCRRCMPPLPSVTADCCAVPLSVAQVARVATRAAGMPETDAYVTSVDQRAALFAAPESDNQFGD